MNYNGNSLVTVTLGAVTNLLLGIIGQFKLGNWMGGHLRA